MHPFHSLWATRVSVSWFCCLQTLRWYVLVLGTLANSNERMNIAVSATLMDACVSNIGEGIGPQERWTLMIYMAGDSDLAYYAVLDLYEILEAPRNANLKIVALVDRSSTDKNSLSTSPKLRVPLIF